VAKSCGVEQEYNVRLVRLYPSGGGGGVGGIDLGEVATRPKVTTRDVRGWESGWHTQHTKFHQYHEK